MKKKEREPRAQNEDSPSFARADSLLSFHPLFNILVPMSSSTKWRKKILRILPVRDNVITNLLAPTFSLSLSLYFSRETDPTLALLFSFIVHVVWRSTMQKILSDSVNRQVYYHNSVIRRGVKRHKPTGLAEFLSCRFSEQQFLYRLQLFSEGKHW